MRRFQTSALVAMLAVAAAACNEKKLVTETGFEPTAGVRFINAVPDSAGAYGMDMRFVDLLESNAHFRVGFRGSISSTQPFTSAQIQYKGALAGNRQFRVFLNDTLQSIAQTVLADETVDLVEGHNYTGIMWGYGRSTGSDAMRFDFWDEDFSSMPTLVGTQPTQVGIRILNTTNQTIEARIYPGSAAVAPTPATATLVTIPPLSRSAYTLDTAGNYMVNVRVQGSGTNYVTTDTRSLPGSFALCSGATTTATRACVAPHTAVWNSTTNYAAGTLIRGSDTLTYMANVANIGIDPTLASSKATWTVQPAPDIASMPGTLVRGSAVTAIVFPAVATAVAAPGASTGALAAAAGNIPAGSYTYKVTFVTAAGETQGGAASNAVVVVNPAVAGQINLTGIPLGPAVGSTTTGPVNPEVIARRIYRVAVIDGAVESRLVGELTNNTATTFTDNVPNTGLGKTMPTANTTIKTPQGAAFLVPAVSWMWDKRPPRGCLPAYCGE